MLIGLLLTSWEWPFRVLSKLAIFTVSFGPSSPLNRCTHASPWCFCRMWTTSASYHGDMSKDHEMHSNNAPIFAIFAFVTRKEELQHILEFFLTVYLFLTCTHTQNICSLLGNITDICWIFKSKAGNQITMFSGP